MNEAVLARTVSNYKGPTNSDCLVKIEISLHVEFEFMTESLNGVRTELRVDEKYNVFGVRELCYIGSDSICDPGQGVQFYKMSISSRIYIYIYI